MQSTLVVIMGLPVAIKYAIHDPAYVEWTLEGVMVDCLEDYPNDEMKLLEVLLRTHYSEFIESCCREACYYDNYASQAAVADDWADSLRYVSAAKNLFKDEDVPF